MSGPSADVLTPGPGLGKRNSMAFDPCLGLLLGVQRRIVQVDGNLEG